MHECGLFPSTLYYETPAHGSWGVVRIGMLAPESYQFFICPFACGRHGALGTVQQGLKDRLSYYFIDQSDIVSGYDDVIPHAVDELLAHLGKRPRAMFVFVSCLDDLIGTDCDAVEEKLNRLHPDIVFRMSHMNPISLDSEEPPPVGIQKRIYSLLSERKEHDAGVNSVGNLVAIDPACELHRVLKAAGRPPLRHISAYSTFDGWQEMAGSSANLVFTPAGLPPAKDLEQRCGIPFRFLPVSYDMEEIEREYRGLAKLLGLDFEKLDFSGERDRALRAVVRTRALVGELPLVLDASAVTHPFGLAMALQRYGFRVKRIFVQNVVPSDQKAFEWVRKNMPSAEIIQPQHYDIVKYDRRLRESLAIGFNAAYISDSRHVIDLFADEGMFGYRGVEKIMMLMEQAMGTESNVRDLIYQHGLVV